jgi:hypothetical protein
MGYVMGMFLALKNSAQDLKVLCFLERLSPLKVGRITVVISFKYELTESQLYLGMPMPL